MHFADDLVSSNRSIAAYEKNIAAAADIVLNDSRYGMILDKTGATLTLLRSVWNPEPYNEIGRHQIRYSINMFDTSASISDWYHTGDQFNQNFKPREIKTVKIIPSNKLHDY